VVLSGRKNQVMLPYRKAENFISASHLGLDRDEESRESSIEGLLKDQFIIDHGAIVHETSSSTSEKPRSRVVFLLDSPITDPKEYRLAAEALTWKYSTADVHCKDEARMFFGRKNARHVVLGNMLYKDILYEEVIEPYQRYKASTNGHNFASPLSDTIPEHERNTTLTSIAGTMRRRGIGEAAIYAALQAENTARCVPPLPDDEVQRIAHSIARYEPAPYAWDSAEPEEEWPEMGDLPQSPTPPLLPPAMVPEPLRPWTLDIARQGCFPLEMVAAPALVGASAIIGRKLGIRPWRFSDFTIPPNLWGCLVSPPASLKSNAIDQAIRPVKRLAATAHDRFQVGVAQDSAHLCALEAEVEGLKSLMKRGAKKGTPIGDLEDQIADKLQQLDAARGELVERRYWVADSTTEKLTDLLKDNSNGLLVCYDEIAGWLADMEKPGREGSRAFYLAAWEGTGDYYVDRVGRGSSYIPAVCLSVIGGIQPDRLRRHIDEALSGGSGGDGLLQRFQLMIYVDNRCC
jgi:hypothetical protein